MSLLEVLNPGGKEEVKSLQQWVRSPPTSQTFDEAFKVLRRWQLAVSRLSTLGLPPLSAHEKLGALDSILQKLEKKSEPLRFKLQALRMAPEIRRPQDAAVQQMLSQVEEEVRILQADERTKFNRQGFVETVFRAEVKQASRPAPTKNFCQFFAQGHCKKGDQCTFPHLSPCRFFALGHCKHGDGCRYPHIKDTSGAPRAPPKAHSAKAGPKRPEAKSKAKAAAAEGSVIDDGQARASSVRSLAMAASTPPAPVANHATSGDERMVLIDSGANEVIRPFRPELEKQLQKLSAIQVALASGEAVSAYRTRDGELILPVAAGASAEWIAPLERLTVGLNCIFSWRGADGNPTLHVPQENGALQPIQVILKNRLPYISWADFQPLRRRLAKLWQGKPVRCLACQAIPSAVHSGPLPSSSSSEQRGLHPTVSVGRGLDVNSSGQPDLRNEKNEDDCKATRPAARPGPLPSSSSSEQRGLLPTASVGRGLEVNSYDLNEKNEHIFEMETLHTLGKKLMALGFGPPPEPKPADHEVFHCNSCRAAVSRIIDLEDEDVPVEVAGGSSELCPEKAALKNLQDRCQQGLYDRQCETCLKSKGYRRPHRKLAAESISNGVLSMDLSGPHPTSLDGHKYMLVTALRLANGTVLPFVRTLPNKESSTVLSALLQVMAQISSMTGGIAVYFRVHSDCGGEFTATKVVEQIHALGLWKTTTAAYSPESNGVAERMVQRVKDDATRCLLHSELPLQFWAFAARHSTFAARQRALGLPIPDSVPKVGQKVLVRKVNADSFSSRLNEAVFLREDETVPNGAWKIFWNWSRSR